MPRVRITIICANAIMIRMAVSVSDAVQAVGARKTGARTPMPSTTMDEDDAAEHQLATGDSRFMSTPSPIGPPVAAATMRGAPWRRGRTR